MNPTMNPAMNPAVTIDSFTSKDITHITLPSGQEVPARIISVLDERLLAKYHPSPQPPLERPPNTGSAAAPRPNREHPQYIADFGRWYDEDQMIRIAISTGMQLEGASWDQLIQDQLNTNLAAWCTRVIELLEPVLSSAWILEANKLIEKQSIGELIDQAGLGNSSTLSTSTDSSAGING